MLEKFFESCEALVNLESFGTFLLDRLDQQGHDFIILHGQVLLTRLILGVERGWAHRLGKDALDALGRETDALFRILKAERLCEVVRDVRKRLKRKNLFESALESARLCLESIVRKEGGDVARGADRASDLEVV